MVSFQSVVRQEGNQEHPSCHLDKDHKQNNIYNAKNAAVWMLQWQQAADDLNLPKAGDEVGKSLLSCMKWV
jgi:hypothetical protein